MLRTERFSRMQVPRLHVAGSRKKMNEFSDDQMMMRRGNGEALSRNRAEDSDEGVGAFDGRTLPSEGDARPAHRHSLSVSLPASPPPSSLSSSPPATAATPPCSFPTMKRLFGRDKPKIVKTPSAHSDVASEVCSVHRLTHLVTH